jgi:hypothetical protein
MPNGTFETVTGMFCASARLSLNLNVMVEGTRKRQKIARDILETFEMAQSVHIADRARLILALQGPNKNINDVV